MAYDSYKVFGRYKDGDKIRLEAKILPPRSYPTVQIGSSVYSDSGTVFDVSYVSGDWIHAVKPADEFGLAARPLEEGSGFDVLRYSGGTVDAQRSGSTGGSIGSIAESVTDTVEKAVSSGSDWLKIAAVVAGLYFVSQIGKGDRS